APARTASVRVRAATAIESVTKRFMMPASRTFRIALVERKLFVVEADIVARDEDVRERGSYFERIAPRDDEVRDLARFDASETVSNAENLRRGDRQRSQRLVARQSPRDRFRGLVGELARIVGVARRERD